VRDGPDAYRRQAVQHSGGSVLRRVLTKERAVAGGQVLYFLSQHLHKSAQGCPEVSGVDYGPLWDVVGVDCTLK
jgi:hypothetical protein